MAFSLLSIFDFIIIFYFSEASDLCKRAHPKPRSASPSSRERSSFAYRSSLFFVRLWTYAETMRLLMLLTFRNMIRNGNARKKPTYRRINVKSAAISAIFRSIYFPTEIRNSKNPRATPKGRNQRICPQFPTNARSTIPTATDTQNTTSSKNVRRQSPHFRVFRGLSGRSFTKVPISGNFSTPIFSLRIFFAC